MDIAPKIFRRKYSGIIARTKDGTIIVKIKIKCTISAMLMIFPWC
jgi:hypothetical protein